MFATVREPNGSAQYADLVAPGRYLAKLVRLEDDGESTFPDPNHKEGQPIKHRIRWIFNLSDPQARTALVNPDGTKFEIFHWTSNATGAKSSARPLFEALLHRPLVPGDGGDALAQEAIGKVAWAMVDQQTQDDGMGGTRTRLKILSMTPYNAAQKAGAAVQSAAMPQAVAVAPKQVAIGVAEADAFAEPAEDEVPF